MPLHNKGSTDIKLGPKEHTALLSYSVTSHSSVHHSLKSLVLFRLKYMPLLYMSLNTGHLNMLYTLLTFSSHQNERKQNIHSLHTLTTTLFPLPMQVVIKYECFISFSHMTDFILFIIQNFHGN